METEIKAVKRQRSENWLDEDKMILKELLRERVSIIENKNTDANTNAKKVAAWNNLLTSFNNMGHTPRTLKQIKAQWGIIKMEEKKKKCLERKQRLQTGGGPPSTTDTPTGDDIAVWLPHEFTVDTNEFDSDSQIPQSGISTKTEDNSQTASTSKQCGAPEITTTPKKKELRSPKYKLKNNKQINKGSASAALQIAAVEIVCRKELHEAQMANEKQKLKNLLLKEEVLKNKLLYYQNKLN